MGVKLATVFFVDTVATADPSQIQGRAVANLDFIVALLRHPDVERLDVFVNTEADAAIVRQQLLRRMEEEPPAALRIPLVDMLPRLLGKELYDAFHHTDPLLQDIAAARARFGDPRTVLTGLTHTLSDIRLLERLPGLFAAPLTARDTILCTSAAAERCLTNLFSQLTSLLGRRAPLPLQLKRLPLGVDPARFSGMTKSEARSRLALPDDRVILLSFSRISALTKMDLVPLLRTLAELPPSVRRPALVIAGAAAAPFELARLEHAMTILELEDDVVILPDLNEADKLACYRAADVFVSLSDNIQETFGLTILEAMAAGLPVIASDFSAYRELVEDGVTGHLVPTLWADCADAISALMPLRAPPLSAGLLGQSMALDLRALRRAIIDLCTDAGARARLAKAAIARAGQFRWDQAASGYLELIAELRQMDDAPSITSTGLPTTAECPRGGGISLFEAFSHFPSRLLAAGTCLMPSSRGRALIRNETTTEADLPLQLLSQLAPLFPLLVRAYGTRATVAQVIELVAETRHALRPDETLLCTLWLIKHGYLEFPAATDAGRSEETLSG